MPLSLAYVAKLSMHCNGRCPLVYALQFFNLDLQDCVPNEIASLLLMEGAGVRREGAGPAWLVTMYWVSMSRVKT